MRDQRCRDSVSVRRNALTRLLRLSSLFFWYIIDSSISSRDLLRRDTSSKVLLFFSADLFTAMQSFLGDAGKGGNALNKVSQREGVDNSLFRVSRSVACERGHAALAATQLSLLIECSQYKRVNDR